MVNIYDILLVEDNPNDEAFIKQIFASSKYSTAKISVAKNLEQVEQYRNKKFDLLLVDFWLPDSQGLETIKSVRSIFKSEVLVILTNTENDYIAIDLLKERAFNYISKTELSVKSLGSAIRFSFERNQIINELQNAKKDLQLSESLYRNLFENMLNGFALLKVVFEKNNAIDCVFISTNEQYEIITGFAKVEGKSINEVIEDFHTSDPAFYPNIDKLIQTGKPISYEVEMKALDKWLLVSIYTPEEGYVINIIENITQRKKLEQQQSLLASVVNSTNDAIITENLRGKITSWNNGAVQLLGYTESEAKDQLYTHLLTDPFSYYKNGLNKPDNANNNFISYETHWSRKNGSKIEVSITITPITDSKSNIVGISTIARDISEIKSSQKKLEKSNRIYAVRSQINKTIVHLENEQILFQNTCDIVVKIGRFSLAWIALLGNSPGNSKLVASCGANEKDIELLSDYDYDENGSMQKVMEGFDYYVMNDLEAEKTLKHYDHIIGRGFKSLITLPLKKAGQIVAFLTISSKEKDYFDSQEIAMLREVSDDISFAMELFERDKKQKETEEKVVAKDRLFRAIIEKSSDMKSLTTREGKIIYGSPSIKEKLGYNEDEFESISAFDFMHPNDIPPYLEKRGTVLQKAGNSFQMEIRLRHKMGHWVWVESVVTNQLDELGINAIVVNFRDITDRKLAEQQREFDQNNLFALINNTHDMMWSVDTEFKLINCNQKFSRLIKAISGSNIHKGDDVRDIGFSKERQENYTVFLNRAFAGENFTETEFVKGVRDLWFQVSYHPIRNGGQVVGSACHSRNITAMKKAELKLVKSEAFGKEIINSLSSQIAVVDFSGKIVAVNDSWNRFALANGGQLISNNVYDYNYLNVCKKAAAEGDQMAADMLTGINSVIDKSITSFYFEYPIEVPSESLWYSMLVKRFDNHEPLLVISHQNISERKKAELNHLNSEARLKEAEKVALVGSWEVNLKSNTHVWSEGFSAIFGYNKNVIASQDAFMATIHPEDVGLVIYHISLAYEQFTNGTILFKFIKKDTNEIRYCYFEYRFEFDKENNPIRLFGIAKDITEQRLAEKEKENILKEIIKQNKDLEQFAFIISHNLRLPVANIIGIADILKHDTLAEEERDDFFAELINSVKKLDEVVSDLNNVLKAKQDITSRKEHFTLSYIVDSIKNSIKNTIDQEQANIVTDFSEFDSVCSIKSYMYSVFFNLISNSIKYRQKEIPLVIKIRTIVTANSVFLSFKDNGSGIDLEKNKDQIFGLYKRFHSNIEGKGMGLFMVKTQVESMGGKINLKSVVNEGTEFIIEFDKSQLV